MNYAKRLLIEHIKVGFGSVVQSNNFADLHRSLRPFGLKWGRGILIKGDNYIDAVTDSYGTTHSNLKEYLSNNESTAGTFYYGYNQENKTLYLEYASDCNFSFDDEVILNAIMKSLKEDNGPLKDFKTRQELNV